MSYIVTEISHIALTAKLNGARITGPLRVIPPEYEQSRGWRASSLHDCLRQTGYRLANAEETHDTYNPDWTLSADIGTAIHVRIQEQLVASGLAITIDGKPAIELTVRHGDLSGHVDAVIRTNNGKLAIFDMKTGDPKHFAPDYPYLGDKWQKWATQMHVYMAYFVAPECDTAPQQAFIYHVCRGDTSLRRLYRISWQPKEWLRDTDRLEAAQSAVALGKLPAAEPGACRFCAYRGHCGANTWRGA